MFIGAWFPNEWVQQIDRLVMEEDLDRSKVLRRAVRAALAAPSAQKEAA